MSKRNESWERIEKDGRDLEHHIEDLVRMSREPKQRLQYEEWIDGIREIRREAHRNAEDIAIDDLEHLVIEESPHTPASPHLIHDTGRHNPVNWERQALWHEAEGSKPSIPKTREGIPPLPVVSQNVKRREIVDALCKELKEAGFTPLERTQFYTAYCTLYRAEEMKCFVERALPHYMAEDTRRWAREFLTEIKRREEKPRRARIPFKCPA